MASPLRLFRRVRAQQAPGRAVAEAQRARELEAVRRMPAAEPPATAAADRTIEELRAPPKPEPPSGVGFMPAPKTAAEHVNELEAIANDEHAQDLYWEDRVANVHPKDALAELDRLEEERREMLADTPDEIIEGLLSKAPPEMREELEQYFERYGRGRASRKKE